MIARSVWSSLNRSVPGSFDLVFVDARDGFEVASASSASALTVLSLEGPSV